MCPKCIKREEEFQIEFTKYYLANIASFVLLSDYLFSDPRRLAFDRYKRPNGSPDCG